jgi:chromosome segregation ATPase
MSHAQISNLAEQLARATSSSSNAQDDQAAHSHIAPSDPVSIRTQLAFALEDAASSTFDARSLRKWLYQEICRVEHLKAKMIDKERELDGLKKERTDLVDKVAKLELDRKRVADEGAELSAEWSGTNSPCKEHKDPRDQVGVPKTEVDALRSQKQPAPGSDELCRGKTTITLRDGYFPPRSVRNALSKLRNSASLPDGIVTSGSPSSSGQAAATEIPDNSKRVFIKPVGQLATLS